MKQPESSGRSSKDTEFFGFGSHVLLMGGGERHGYWNIQGHALQAKGLEAFVHLVSTLPTCQGQSLVSLRG